MMLEESIEYSKDNNSKECSFRYDPNLKTILGVRENLSFNSRDLLLTQF